MTVKKREKKELEMTCFTNFGSRGASRADLHRKPPITMVHESLIQRRPSLSHPGWLKYFFSDMQSVTLNYHTPRLTDQYVCTMQWCQKTGGVRKIGGKVGMVTGLLNLVSG